MFDAIAHGALCSECPFRKIAVPPKGAVGNPRLVLVGESPGGTEELEGELLCGMPGRFVKKCLQYWKVSFADCYVTKAVLCRPPLKAPNADWKKAMACCKPRLDAELSPYLASGVPVFVMGEYALRALSNKCGITKWMGSPLTSQASTVIPSLSPVLVMASPAYEPVFRQYMGYAINGVAWSWPEMIIDAGDDACQMYAKLMREGTPVGVDVETAGISAAHDPLLCIGVGNKHGGVTIPWPCQDVATEAAFRRILSDTTLVKALHNSQFDLISLEANNIEIKGKIFDTLLAHVTVAPQLRHDLGFVATMELPGVPRWKEEFRAGGAEKGAARFARAKAEDLRLYNCKDAIVTGMLV